MLFELLFSLDYFILNHVKKIYILFSCLIGLCCDVHIVSNFILQGSGGFSYLIEPLWWLGMITSKYIAQTLPLFRVIRSSIVDSMFLYKYIVVYRSTNYIGC